MSDISTTVRDVYDSLPQWARVAIGGVALAVPSLYLMWGRKGRKSPLTADWKPGTVYLYQFPRVNYVANLSPYCLKLESFLRMAEIPYENVPIEFMRVRSKEGMLPFIELNGVEYDDSGLIMDLLPSMVKCVDPDGGLDKSDLAAARAFEQMVENSFVMAYAYFRYTQCVEELLSEKILGMKLPILWTLLPLSWTVSRGVKTKLYHHGIGRHSPEDIAKISNRDAQAINDFLDDKKFLLGSKISRVDATIFSVLSQVLYLPLETPQKTYILKECPKLVEYTERVRDKVWPDWKDLTNAKNTNK